MNLKKHIAKTVAAVTSLCAIASLPWCLPSSAQETVVYNDFEVNYDGWYGNSDSVRLTAQNAQGFDNSRGMLVSGRKSVTDGASSSKGFYLTGNTAYDYSIQVFSETDQTFRLNLTCKDLDTDFETTRELACVQVKAGQWTEISTKDTAPVNSYEFRLDLTTDSTQDFRFDHVVITTEEKSGKNLNTVYAANSEKGLKDEFANYFRVGNILNNGTVKNSAITANILKDFNSIECENETKPDATMVQSQCTGTNIAVSLNNAAAIFDFCIQNHIAVRGHTLVWHSQTPSWFFKDNFQNNGNWVSSSVMDQRMESYIKNMFQAIETQYPDLNLYAYDVANECISDDSNRTNNGQDGARVAGDSNVTGGTSAWVSVYGNNSFVEKAFTYARKYAPEGCALYYNDYNEYWDHKRDSIYAMCKSLYEKGLLDGIGMQSHIPANATGFAGTDSYIEAMDKYLSIGCDLQVTELDISLESGKYTLQEQADKYKAIFQHAMDVNTSGKYNGRVTAVCIWGPNDANSWLKAGSNALLYDANNQPKLAYKTLMAMIPESEWGDGSNPAGNEIEPNEYGWYFHDTFEGSTDGWEARGSAEILTSGRTAYIDKESLLIKDRTAAWNGAQKTLNTKAFVPGNVYSFSVNVVYYDGDATDQFALKLEYTDANGDTQYATIAQGSANKEKWVQLANKNYKIPADAKNMKLYVETTESLNNFYIDEAIGAVGGTTILGAGEAEKNILGDLNSDGLINIYDLCLAKQAIKNGEQQVAGDVNQDGELDAEDIKLIQQFLHGKITKFPKSEKSINVAAMNSLFSEIKTTASYKSDSENNPLFTQRFGADPGVMEYNGRIYVYTTNDVIEYDSNGTVTENSYALVDKINCISSDDMVNWTDHGAIQVAGKNGAAKWASCSWAPAAAHKKINGKEKFFLYFCNGGNGVSVLTADSPTGPWSDPLGKALITRSVANCSNITWLFDPAVFVDDDGTGYLCFGGGVPEGKTEMPDTSRIVKLGADMISLAGDPVTIHAPYIFEDSGINKINNKYYYTYCSNWNTSGNKYNMTSGAIEYMTADNPLGPYTYGGELFKNQGNFFGLYGNNHHSIVELDNQLYLFYHSRPVEKAMGIEGNYRSPQVDQITMNGEKINPVTGTMTGIAQLKNTNPYFKVEAETMSNQSNDIVVNGLGNTTVSVNKGSWTKVSNVAFTKGISKVTVKASSKNGSAVKICTGSPEGEAIAYVEIPKDGSMHEMTVPVVKNLKSTENLYFVFSNQTEFDYWYFS